MGDLERLSRALSRQEQDLTELSSSISPLSFVLDPLVHMTQQAKAAIDTLPSSLATADAADVWSASDKAVEKMLIVAQAFGKDDPLTNDNADRPVSMVSKQTLDMHSTSLRFSDVDDQLRAFAETLACSPLEMGESPSQVVPAIQQLLPYLAGYAFRLDRYLSSHATWSKALYKLDYVLVRTFTTLSAKGFCKPQETDNQKGSGQEGQMEMDGTGLGSGSGENNVSNEIEDESQVEGLRGEEEQDNEDDQPKDRDGDNDAVEMQDDFEGALEDVEEDDKDNQQEGDDEEEDDEKQDMDEHVGDVGEDAVDDQFWGDDEEDKRDEGGNDQLDKNQNQEKGESEMAAKEEDAGKGKDRPEQQGEDDGAEEQPDNEEEDVEGEQEDQGEEERGEDGAGAALDSTMPEVETLDLPEEMALDDAEGSDQLEDFEDDGMEGEDVEDEDGGSAQNEAEDDADNLADNEPDHGEAGEDEAKEDAQSLLPQEADDEGDSGETEAQNGVGAQGGLDNSDAKLDKEQADSEAQEQDQQSVDDIKEGQG